ncbi:Uncharacterized protein SCF082_LOCUS3670 [Durusdinium trenchii]|uniref:Uncharacterized protein n=1 Tax=Durusdinium trenchii TaxID=1381693 RepID=A0ABP0HVZ1_9DINO
MTDLSSESKNDWLFDGDLLPAHLDVSAGNDFENLLEEDLLLDEALNILSTQEEGKLKFEPMDPFSSSGHFADDKQQVLKQQPRPQPGQLPVVPQHVAQELGGSTDPFDQEILLSLVGSEDQDPAVASSSMEGLGKKHSDDIQFVGDLQRSLSPIKSILYPEKLSDHPRPSQSGRGIGMPPGSCNSNGGASNKNHGSHSERKESIRESGSVVIPNSVIPRAPGGEAASAKMAQLESPSDKNGGNNLNPWPSAKQYVEIIRQFAHEPSKFRKYTIAELGRCKLTNTPQQPSWIYTDPRPGIYFLECENLRGRGSFGFPKCELIGKKSYEWKKTSYVNNVPKAKPVVSYITANGNASGAKRDGSTVSYRMRIVKAIDLDVPNADEVSKFCLVDIHVSMGGLTRRKGPRPKKQTVASLATSDNAVFQRNVLGRSPTRTHPFPQDKEQIEAAAAVQAQRMAMHHEHLRHQQEQHLLQQRIQQERIRQLQAQQQRLQEQHQAQSATRTAANDKKPANLNVNTEQATEEAAAGATHESGAEDGNHVRRQHSGVVQFQSMQRGGIPISPLKRLSIESSDFGFSSQGEQSLASPKKMQRTAQ